jgi:hypothetical protein
VSLLDTLDPQVQDTEVTKDTETQKRSDIQALDQSNIQAPAPQTTGRQTQIPQTIKPEVDIWPASSPESKPSDPQVSDYSTSDYRQDTSNPSDKAAKAGLLDAEASQSVSQLTSQYQTSQAAPDSRYQVNSTRTSNSARSLTTRYPDYPEDFE